MKANGKRRSDPKCVGLVGLAFDCADGHTRLTRGPDFALLGGSDETHAQMQETVIKVNEQLDKRGKRISEATIRELRDIFNEVSGD